MKKRNSLSKYNKNKFRNGFVELIILVIVIAVVRGYG